MDSTRGSLGSPPVTVRRRRRQAGPVGRAAAAVIATLLAVGVSEGVPSVAAAKPSAPTRPLSARGIAGWRLAGSYDESSLTAGEGVATVTRPGGHGRYELYRGIVTIPKNLAAEGWTHIGDPDSMNGDIIDAYQGPSSGHSKMFLVTEPSGRTVQYVHTLVKGEIYNNSFDAISPGAQWLVAGEWNTMSHLQIYPAPLLNRRTSPSGGALHLVGYIKLDHKINDIQGCDFTTRTTLICVSDDDSRTLFANEKPLLEIELAHALNGDSVKGHVVDLGPIPQRSTCTGTFEAEGVDFDVATGILRVEVVAPGKCVLTTKIYEYAHSRR
jgi:hypothetical protein